MASIVSSLWGASSGTQVSQTLNTACSLDDDSSAQNLQLGMRMNLATSDERAMEHDSIVSELLEKLQAMKDKCEKKDEDLKSLSDKLSTTQRQLDDRHVALKKMEADLEKTSSSRNEIEQKLGNERVKMKKLIEAQKKTSELLEGSQVIAINETRNLTAALAVERQKVVSLESRNKEIVEISDKIKQRLSLLEDKKSSSENFDMKKLLQSEKDKTELLTQAHAQMSKLMEDGMQIGDIFAGKSFSSDPLKASQEKMVLMENHMHTFAKASASIRLRLIKNQKLLMLEKDKASTIQEELEKMNDQMKHETMKMRDLERKVAQSEDHLASQKAEKEILVQRENAAKLYLEAEKGKTQDLLRLMGEKDRKAKKEKEQGQEKIDGLENKTNLLSTQIDVLEGRLKEKEESNAELSKRKEELEHITSDTRKELEKLNAENKEKTEKNAELQRTVDSLESKLSVALNEIKLAAENIRSVQKSLEEKNGALVESQTRVSELDNSLQSAQQRNKEHEAKEAELLNDQTKLVDLLESVKEKLVEKEGALKDLMLARTRAEESSAVKDEKVNCLQQQVQELDLEKQSLSENLEMSRRQVEETEARIQHSESELLRVQEELENQKAYTEKQQREMKTQIERLEQDVSQQESLSVSFEQEITELRNASRIEKESSESIVKQLSHEKLLLEETIEKVKSDLEKMKETRAEKEAEAASLQSALSSEKEEMNKNLGDLYKVLLIEKETSKQLEVMYDESQAELEVQRERANDLLTLKNDLEAKLEETKSDLESSKYSCQQAEEMMAATKEKATEGLKEMEDLTRRFEEANRVLSYERETLKKLEELYDETLAALEVEKTRADGLSHHNSDLTSDLKKHEEELREKGSKIEELQSKCFLMQEREKQALEENGKLTWTVEQFEEVNGSISSFDSMKYEIVRMACILRQRDLLLIAMKEAMSTLRSKTGKDSIRRLNTFVADLSKRTGIAFGEDIKKAGSLVRFGLGLSLTLPLVPLIAIAQNGQTDLSILTQPVLAMMGIMS